MNLGIYEAKGTKASRQIHSWSNAVKLDGVSRRHLDFRVLAPTREDEQVARLGKLSSVLLGNNAEISQVGPRADLSTF